MRNAQRDSRSFPRHTSRTILRVRIWKSPAAAKTIKSENLSERGVFFTTDLPLKVGTSLELEFTMPPEIASDQEPSRRWLGHVVRVVPPDAAGGKIGVGVQFDFYQIVPAVVTDIIDNSGNLQTL